MERNRYKILDNENENIVQFNVVNNTSNPVSLNLFDTSEGLSLIPNSPIYINQPNTVVNSFGAIAPKYSSITINSNSNDVIATNGLNRVFFFNSVGTSISIFVDIGTQFNIIDYNPINNQLYVNEIITGDIFLIDCTTFSLTLIISANILNPFSSAYDSLTNTIYYVNGSNNLFSINCNTNTQSTTFISTNSLNSVSFNSVNNQLYITTTVNSCVIFNLSTLLFSPIIISLPTTILSSSFNSTNNTLYVGSLSTDDIYVINCLTNTFITTINLAGTIPNSLTFNNNSNTIYATSQVPSLNVAVIDCISNTLSTLIPSQPSTDIVFNQNNNFIYVTESVTQQINQITTSGITSNPFFIDGSVNYNLFLNNLNNEPITIQMIRLFVSNINQLFNELQLTKIDSNGNQIFIPYFPINAVSNQAEQGKISEIPFNDIIFDGRTFINQYQLNPNENVSFEIYYKQLDLLSASSTFPIFFKPKIQLKDYIKNN